LFPEVDGVDDFATFCRATQNEPNLQNPEHAKLLLTWLNNWGARIAKTAFSSMLVELAKWFSEWGQSLPRSGLLDLQDQAIESFVAAYEDLKRQVNGFGPTSASKTLFAVRPDGAMPWDAAIQTEFRDYRTLLQRSRDEARMVVCEASTRCGGANQRSIPLIVRAPNKTLPKLLDEYHWVTITRRHCIPTCEELRQWVGLVSLAAGASIRAADQAT
jgi:hypothetical protein